MFRLSCLSRPLICLTLALAGTPAGMLTPPAAAQDCGSAGSAMCELIDGRLAVGTLNGPDDADVYRVDVLDLGAEVRLDPVDAPLGHRVRLLDWRGRSLAETAHTDQQSAAPTSASVPAPGAYQLVVDIPAADRAEIGGSYRVEATVAYREPPPRVILSSAAVPDGPPDASAATELVDGGYILETARGGSRSSGVAVARALHLPDGGEVGDFMLTADVRFVQPVRSAAATVRFRYQPEAGGGTGYLLSIDPFAARVRLMAFAEGQRVTITPWTPHPIGGGGAETFRLVLRASGDTIAVYLDGEEVIRATDARYARGAIAVGGVTWSEPIMLTFENVLVTTPTA